MSMRRARKTRGLPPACCTPAIVSGRWSSIAGPRTGRLSEVARRRTLRIDRRFVTLELAAAAEAEWRASPPEDPRGADQLRGGRQRADGGNDRAPPAARVPVLRLTPAPWTPVDSLAVGRLLAWRLAENHQSELVRHALAARFGADGCAAAWRAVSGRMRRPWFRDWGVGSPGVETRDQGPGNRGSGNREQGAGSRRIAAVRRRRTTGRTGSSGWRPMRGGGSRTTGSSPGAARRAAGRCSPTIRICRWSFRASGTRCTWSPPDWTSSASSIPGTPFVVLGHNARIAWGVTNTGADVQDLYVERIDLARRRYLYRGQWLPVDGHRGRDPGPRRGVADVRSLAHAARRRCSRTSASTGRTRRRGCSPGAERTGERRAFALRWDVGGETAGAFEALNRAATGANSRPAVERFAAPSQNFVYADVDGNIGYAMSGRAAAALRRASG